MTSAAFSRPCAPLKKELEFAIYATGMAEEELSTGDGHGVSVSYFQGYLEAANLDRLKKAARDNAWGLLAEDPNGGGQCSNQAEKQPVRQLIYPITDFLGTVPGYFEFDISSWFLLFLLIFFGIIFGDGGYGLLICAAAAIPAVKALVSKKAVSPTILLVGLFGLSTVLWGTLTCTWFGLSAEQVPQWLQNLSVPVISNVYADRLWYPFGPDGGGLTVSQNLQIFCFIPGADPVDHRASQVRRTQSALAESARRYRLHLPAAGHLLRGAQPGGQFRRFPLRACGGRHPPSVWWPGF